MGISRFSGPVYGAKSLLWTFGPYTQTGSTGASTALVTANAARTVPNYEDWYITEVNLQTSTNSSVAAAHGVYLKTEGGSTTGIPRVDGVSTRAATLASFTNPAGSTTWSTWATVVASQGEFEGSWVPAGSTLRILSSGVSFLGGLQINVMGFIRYVDSTRSVG
jgi:hypothetical protein